MEDVMADNHTQFSESLDIPSFEAAQWIRKVLELDPEVEEDLTALKSALSLTDIEQAELDPWPQFEWEIENENQSLWLHCDYHCDFDHIIWFMQSLLKKFMPTKIFTLTNAETCSKPRIGEFGGGWLVVSASEVKNGNTWEACEKAVEEIQENNEHVQR
jgi:hypothetical protein